MSSAGSQNKIDVKTCPKAKTIKCFKLESDKGQRSQKARLAVRKGRFSPLKGLILRVKKQTNKIESPIISVSELNRVKK